MSWIRDAFRPEVEVVVAPPSTAVAPVIKRGVLVDALQSTSPTSESVTLGSDVFKAEVDEAPGA